MTGVEHRLCTLVILGTVKRGSPTDKGAVAANPGEQRGRVRPYWLIPSRVRCGDVMTNVLLLNSDTHLIWELRRSRRLDRNLA
jgi:hypothetical protein